MLAYASADNICNNGQGTCFFDDIWHGPNTVQNILASVYYVIGQFGN